MKKNIMKGLAKVALAFLVALLPSQLSSAQKRVRELSRGGTKFYEKKDFSKAEIEYRKALEINPNDKVSSYNLANTLYRTKRGEEASKLYQTLLEAPRLTETEKADATHNLGNVFMGEKKYAEAIKVYKISLRVRPDDEETRYNLALAQKLMGQQNQQQNQQQDKNKEKEDKQDESKDQDQKKQENPEDQSNKEDKTQQQESKAEEKMSKDNANKILDAFLKDEKDTQKKVDKAKQLRGPSNKNQKQW
ncbi:MAG: tetratricopeptide repeat protein [Porphyromonas sp.]|nr:tetratricopeptide repeat protein [Porphyromonas sp.]